MNEFKLLFLFESISSKVSFINIVINVKSLILKIIYTVRLLAQVDAEPNKDGLLSSKISLTDLQEEEENANNNKYITKIFQPKQK